LRLRVLSAARHQAREPPDGGDREDREVGLPHAGGDLERASRLEAGGEERRLLEGEVRRARQGEEREQAAPSHREGLREDEEEMEQQRRQQSPIEVLAQEERLPDRIARAGGRDDVDREGREAEAPEDPSGARPVARHGEEPDQQVEEADEREEEIGPVESEARTRERELPHLAAGENEQAVGEWLAGEALLRLRKRSGGLTIRGDDPVARLQARRRRGAGRLDGRDRERTLGTLVAEPGPGEAVDLSRERQEAQP